MKRLVLASAVLLAGCAQVLGLDNTRFDQRDAGTDAPSLCDGDPVTCTSGSGRSVCGRIRGTGDTAGLPLRVADPKGAQCQPADTEGPCAFTVAALPVADFFAGSASGRVTGTIDDCGRYVVLDLPASEADLAITFDATDYNKTASLLIGRPTMPGTDRDVDGLAVTEATRTAWATQIGDPTLDLTTGFLIRYSATADRGGPPPTMPTRVAKGGGNALVNTAGEVPWASYFAGNERFGTIDPAQLGTGASGTAIAVLGEGGGAYSVDGVSMGSRCRVLDLDQVTNTLIYVIGLGC